MTRSIVLALLLSSLALADEPSTEPADAYPALSKAIARLKAENDQLKQQVKTLEADNARLSEAVAKKPATPSTATPSDPKVGMTEDEAIACYDSQRHPHEVTDETDRLKVITIYHFVASPRQQIGELHKEPWKEIVVDKESKKVFRISRVSDDSPWENEKPKTESLFKH